jgi:hypothetical protein|nr:MAG TPA: hypothetical protein [Caudoviricetes sp.]
MKNNKLMGIVVGASALVGANTFSKGKTNNTNPAPRKVSSMSCSIDSKVRSEIRKGIKEHGDDDTVVLEIPAECRVNGAKNKSWKKGTLYVDVKTAKSIQKNPDVNEIRSTRGSRYISEEKSYIMYNTDYSLKANYHNKHEEKDSIFATVEKNLKKVFKKKDNKQAEAPKQQPKCNCNTVDTKKDAKQIADSHSHKPATKPTTVKKPAVVAKKKNITDKEIENIINKAANKYS